MSEATFAAMREFIRVAVELEVKKAMPVIPETRSAEPVVGPPGKDGAPGKDGIDGKDGRDGKDGTNGIATRNEIEEIIERRVSEINVRTFADIYKGVYKPGELYTRGSLVTWDGSVWVSKVDTEAKPGLYADWQLVVKRGADGRK